MSHFLLTVTTTLIWLLVTVASASPAGNKGAGTSNESALSTFLLSHKGYKLPYDYSSNLDFVHSNNDQIHDNLKYLNLDLDPQHRDSSWVPVKYNVYHPKNGALCLADGGYSRDILDPAVFTPELNRLRHYARLEALQKGLYEGREGDYYISEHNDNVLTKAMKHMSDYRGALHQDGFLYLPDEGRILCTPGFNYKVPKAKYDNDGKNPMARLARDTHGLWRLKN